MNGLFKHVKENQFILLENDGNDNLISRKEEDMALQVIRIKLIPQASKIWNTRHTRMPLITNTEINKNLIKKFNNGHDEDSNTRFITYQSRFSRNNIEIIINFFINKNKRLGLFVTCENLFGSTFSLIAV
jgi:hypothetical protein